MSSTLRAVLERQRQSFLDDGPPGVTARRNRIDRLLALVLDNTEAFMEAMAADFGTAPDRKWGTGCGPGS